MQFVNNSLSSIIMPKLTQHPSSKSYASDEGTSDERAPDVLTSDVPGLEILRAERKHTLYCFHNDKAQRLP
jgi:hypothetical protein